MSDTRTLDLRGVACPLNFVKTKLLIDKLNPGDTVEALLDEGEPVESVCSSMQAEGHELILQEKTPAGHCRVVIRKSAT